MKLLVTGAGGFVGVHLVREIASRGHEVTAVSLESPTRAAAEFLAEYEAWVTWTIVDVREEKRVEEVLLESRADAVIHGAAVTSAPRGGGGSPEELLATNVLGTVHVLETVRRLGLERVIFLSSGAVYGDHREMERPLREDDPLRSESPYAVSKIVAEQLCRHDAEAHGYTVVICRLGTLYGPVEIANPHRPHVSIPCRLASLALKRNIIRVCGASRKRPYSYIGDAARCIIDLALLPRLTTDTVNVGGGEHMALADLLDVVSRLRPDVRFELVEDARDADLVMTQDDERRLLDTSRLESILGHIEWRHADVGMRQTLEWLRNTSSMASN